MALGYFMGVPFRVSDRRIFTVSNLKGTAGADWSTHNIVGRKAKSQYVAPKLKTYTFEIMLRAQDGVNPRRAAEHFVECAEDGKADYFIIGSRPLSPYPFKITDYSDEWTTISVGGAVIELKMTLTIEEYL